MSSQQEGEEQQAGYGSNFARMFGYVTPEDRSRWEQQRAQNKPNVNVIKLGVTSAVDSMLEFGDKHIQASLEAAHRVAAQRQFDEAHDKVVNMRQDPKTRSIIETVDYETRDHRQEIEPDFEL